MEGSDEDKRRVGAALLAARRKLQSLEGEKPSGPSIIFQVLKELVDIERRMKVRTASPKHLRAQLIEYIHEGWEREEAARQRRIDEAAGDDPVVVWGITLITTPEEVKTHDVVNYVFRRYLVGHNKVRDWRIMLRLGKGEPHRKIAKSFHISYRRVQEIGEMQSAAIWTNVSSLMPKESAGRLWTEADIAA